MLASSSPSRCWRASFMPLFSRARVVDPVSAFFPSSPCFALLRLTTLTLRYSTVYGTQHLFRCPSLVWRKPPHGRIHVRTRTNSSEPENGLARIECPGGTMASGYVSYPNCRNRGWGGLNLFLASPTFIPSDGRPDTISVQSSRPPVFFRMSLHDAVHLVRVAGCRRLAPGRVT